MSGYNTFDECETICICPKCKFRSITCGPCTDCTGEMDGDDGGRTECDNLDMVEEEQNE